MSTLMIAMGIYIVGVAVVLYTRPELMFFAETGAWKEFGLDSGRTIMPFWMFALLWAIISYVSASLLSVYFSGLALQNVPADVIEANIASVVKPVSKSPPPSLPTSVIAPASAAAAPAVNATPGYYVLETPKSGPPKYIYFGTEPPSVENLGRIRGSD
jgi:hypothetical protein